MGNHKDNTGHRRFASDNEGFTTISDDVGDVDWGDIDRQYDSDTGIRLFQEEKELLRMSNKKDINYSVGVSMGSIHSLAYQKTIVEQTNLMRSCFSQIVCIKVDMDPIQYLRQVFTNLVDTVGEELFFFEFRNREGKISDLEMVYKHMRLYYREKDEEGNLVICIGCDTQERLETCLQSLYVYHKKKHSTHWYFLDDDGSLTSAKGSIKDPKDCTEYHVPWVGENVDDFLNAYEESDSPILILIGPPGTGKTSLINYYIHKYGKKSAVTYDQGVINKDHFFISYITDSEQDLLILEDADDIIQRQEGRSRVLSKILNVGDGIVDTSSKKIIITANIDSVENIDPAISRKGRCYSVLTSRRHTPEEANALSRHVGIDKEFKSDISLAELFNGRNPQLGRPQKVGFGF